MAQKILKPRRGRASILQQRNPLLQKGEIIFECPDGGVGTGITKVKIGDGVTLYNDLPYAIRDTNIEEVEIAVETPTKTSGSYTRAELTNFIVTGTKLKTILGAIKGILALDGSDIATMKTNISSNATAIAGKAASSHTHDDRYFTESEINTKLASYLTTSKAGTQVTFSLSGTTLTITPK